MTSGKKRLGEKTVGGPATLIVVLLLLLGGLFMALQYIAGGGKVPAWMEPRARTSRAPASATLEGMGWGVALVKCEEAVRQQLGDPDSAQFPESGRPMFGNGRWSHAGEVSGTNGFGARVQVSYLCEITGTTQADAVPKVQLLQ